MEGAIHKGEEGGEGNEGWREEGMRIFLFVIFLKFCFEYIECSQLLWSNSRLHLFLDTNFVDAFKL